MAPLAALTPKPITAEQHLASGQPPVSEAITPEPRAHPLRHLHRHVLPGLRQRDHRRRDTRRVPTSFDLRIRPAPEKPGVSIETC
jgi:hypothetical protein